MFAMRTNNYGFSVSLCIGQSKDYRKSDETECGVISICFLNGISTQGKVSGQGDANPGSGICRTVLKMRKMRATRV
jgi:hypothetical protein